MTKEQPVIAVVDDEPEMRKALCRLLATRGFRSEEYECGEDFLAALGSRHLDLVLLDLQLPGIKGFEVLEALVLRSIHVPVIVITAHDKPGAAERVRALGACAYLRKPIELEVLLAAIAEASSCTP
jgi:FixJ family two-component response regulator